MNANSTPSSSPSTAPSTALRTLFGELGDPGGVATVATCALRANCSTVWTCANSCE